jgi:serine/threonine-protein kinase
VKRRPEDAAQEEKLDEVIAQYLEAVDAGRRPDPDEWLERFPDLAPALARFFAEEGRVHGLLGPLNVTPVLAGGSTPPCEPRLVSGEDLQRDWTLLSLGDYELLDEVARGGMGVVYRARQKSLNRVVALKRILVGRLACAEEVRRFRYEAELAANLDHPHIVPIYEVGEHDGLPYFTMKFVEGGSLAQHVRRFRSDPRAAARLVAQVARAVHHAHQRGLLHRDLKPANVLLSWEGEAPVEPGDAPGGGGSRKPGSAGASPSLQRCQPHLTDFGLARRLGGGAGLTGSGAAVGTPSYMAPEQANGQAVTTAADVYSLGAILYELLAGTPPFRADHPLETLRQVQEQAPTRPRLVNPKVPRDLETVCLKCLEKDPARRYAGADDLADDLDRFLRGEPIRGRRVGLAGQLWRWCRRRPLPASLAAGLILSVVVGLGLVTWQWRRAEANFARAEEERERALEERARADEGFREAHRAVHDFFRVTSEGNLRDIPGAQKVRKDLLKAALAYYQRFLRERGQDTTLRKELAEVHLRIGMLSGMLGASSQGLAAAQRALAIFRELLRDEPASVPLRKGLASTLTEIGFMQSHTGKVTAALESLAEARRLYEGLRRERPNDLEVQNGVAALLNGIGLAQSKTGRVAAAIETANQARQLREELNRRSPSDIHGKENLARVCLNLAGLHWSLGHRVESGRFSSQARDILEALVKADPANIRYRHLLAEAYRLVAVGLPPAAALPLAQKGHALLVRLCDLEPGAAAFQSKLAASHQLLGFIHRQTGHKAEALAEFEKALAVMQRVVGRHPAVTDFRNHLARCYYDRGVMQNDLGSTAQALESYTAARDIRLALVKANPRNLTYRTDLGVVLLSLSGTLAARGRKQEALEVARQGSHEHRAVFAKAPKVPRYRAALIHALRGRMELALVNGRAAEAASTALELKKLWPAKGRELYIVAQGLAYAAAVAGKKSEVTVKSADAARFADLAVATLREAVAAGIPGNAHPHDDPAFAPLQGRRDFQDILAGQPRTPTR